MDLETRGLGFMDIFNSSASSSSFTNNPITDLETSLIIKSIIEDDKHQLIDISKRLFVGAFSLEDAAAGHQAAPFVSKLLRVCCIFDSVNCAASLINGEVGPVAAVNEVDEETGMTAIHQAAESHSTRCVELLLKKRARTDVKSKDGRGLLALELSLCSKRMDVEWDPSKHSVGDLTAKLGEMNLTTVKLLSEKTKEVDEVAYANAVGGRIVALAALLLVAAEKVNESILVLHDSDVGTKEKTTVYECVIREALALGRGATTTAPLRAVKRNCTPTTSESAHKRKLLLCEIELLQLFGAVARTSRCTDKKVAPPLILATQAGDDAVIELLLNSDNIDVNDTDAEGNSALHWALRTSTGSSQHEQQNRIVGLLLKHGARVSQKNKLGLTALHIAAGSGNSLALEALIREDTDCINFKTIIKETPLFFAVKNDQMVCAELLLRWGANSEVLNLRRERPIDFAKSQDMRFLLKGTNICHTNRALLQEKYNASLESDHVISETCEALLSMMDDGNYVERKTEACKYFESPTGCIRGSKCFYAHGEEELRTFKHAMRLIHSSKEFRRKIFAGGLPLSIDSASLGELFEEHFGSVEDAKVVRVEIEKQIQSRGFGFVTFKHEKSASVAVQTRFVTIMDKQVEIKSAMPKEVLLSELQKQSAHKQELKRDHQSQLEAKKRGGGTPEEVSANDIKEEMLTVKSAEEKPCRNITDEAKMDLHSWAGRLFHGQSKTRSNESQAQVMTSFEVKKMPKWLRILKKWLPLFLKDVYNNPIDGEYALSSLKTDFKAAFGLELDHASLGYPKLSDFIRTIPELCHVTAGTIGKYGSPNHMVLLPSLPRRKVKVLQSLTTQRGFSPVNSTSDNCDSKSPQDLQSVSNEYAGSINSSIERKPSHEIPEGNSARRDTSTSANSSQKNTSVIDYSRFLQFLKPGLYGNAGGSGGNNNERGRYLDGSEEMKLRIAQRHLVLEALARKRNNRSEFFLREYDFYDDYKASFSQGKCFGCKQRPMLYANLPCQHNLWCSDCRIEAARVAEGFEHKCVICDMKVENIVFLPSYRHHQPWHEDLLNPEAFPPLHPSYGRNLQKRNPWENFRG